MLLTNTGKFFQYPQFLLAIILFTLFRDDKLIAIHICVLQYTSELVIMSPFSVNLKFKYKIVVA